jgi:hypothetical protein
MSKTVLAKAINAILIKDGAARERTVRGKQGKGDFTVRYQLAAIENGDDFPRPFQLELGRDRAPYAPGRYAIDSASFTTNEYDSLALRRDIELVRIDDAPAVSAAPPARAAG